MGYDRIRNGGVGERLKPAVLKTVRLERVSGVRIPPHPPELGARIGRQNWARSIAPLRCSAYANYSLGQCGVIGRVRSRALRTSTRKTWLMSSSRRIAWMAG